MKSSTSLELLGALALTSILATGMAGCGDLTEFVAYDVDYTPNGNLVAYLPGEIRVFEGDGGGQIRSIATPAQEDGWLPFTARTTLAGDGRTCAVAAGRRVSIYDLETGARVADILVQSLTDEHNSIAGVALSRMGDLMAAAVRPYGANDTERLAIWRVADGSLVADLSHGPGRASFDWGSGLAFSPDGTTLYGTESGYSDTTTALETHLLAWGTANGHRVWETLLPEPGTSLVVSGDGAYVATAGLQVRLWLTADGSQVETFQAPPQQAHTDTLAFAPDGRHLAATYATDWVEADAHVFGMDGAIVQAFPVEAGGCEGVAFSPDSAHVTGACGRSGVMVWDVTTGMLLARRHLSGYIY